MRLGLAAAISIGVAVWAAQPAAAQELFFFPAQGQSPEQQNRDFGECHAWAVQQTGVNPMTQQGAAPQQATEGGVARGAVTGAAGGALIGAIAGDVGKGAAIGAVGGGMIGGLRRNRNQRQIDQQQQQAYQQRQANIAAYNRALSACMTGKGYSVG